MSDKTILYAGISGSGPVRGTNIWPATTQSLAVTKI